MSWWTYINGTINVDVPGRTQAEIDYILQTILDHLPRVTGSEGDMEVYINRHRGHCSSCSCDEYDMSTNNLTDQYGDKSQEHGWLRTQDRYTLTVNASLRDRMMEQTVKEFMKWLCRLSKRLSVDSVLVRIDGYDQHFLINESGFESPYSAMYEWPSWAHDSEEPAWWEHLMWKRWGNTPLPLTHVVKYYNDPEADEELFKKRGDK